MCASTYAEDSSGNYVTDCEKKDGIYFSHAYTILAAYNVNV